jgi:hypothetical protein
MAAVGAMAGKYKGYGLVRDINGRVKMDDPASCPDVVWNQLTDVDRSYVLNIFWDQLSLKQREQLVRVR